MTEHLLGDSILTEEEQEIWERKIPDAKVILDRAEIDIARRDKVVCWDIETYKWEERPLLIEKIVEDKVSNYVKPDIIEKYRKEVYDKLALDPLTGQIILSGFYNGDGFIHFQGNEKDIIEKTLDEIVKVLVAGYKLVTKGGKRFDLPYLLTRAAIHSVEVVCPYSYKNLFGKYDHFYHTDLENVFEKHSLGSIAYAFGLAEVPGNRGSEIAGMYETGNMNGIVEKNKEDLVQSYNIYQRIKWINL